MYSRHCILTCLITLCISIFKYFKLTESKVEDCGVQYERFNLLNFVIVFKVQLFLTVFVFIFADDRQGHSELNCMEI